MLTKSKRTNELLMSLHITNENGSSRSFDAIFPQYHDLIERFAEKIDRLLLVIGPVRVATFFLLALRQSKNGSIVVIL